MSDALLHAYLRMRLRGRRFSIVTNNCWGADVYRAAGSAYQTPFVGLFIRPPCYLRLLADLRRSISADPSFVARSRYDDVNALRATLPAPYPIGIVGDGIEIHFMHYGSEDEARVKWRRRAARLASADQDLFVKFCDTDGPTPALLDAFDALDYPHRVCFVGTPRPSLRCGWLLPGFEPGGRIHGVEFTRHYRRWFDVADWLRGGSGAPRGLYRALVRALG